MKVYSLEDFWNGLRLHNLYPRLFQACFYTDTHDFNTIFVQKQVSLQIATLTYIHKAPIYKSKQANVKLLLTYVNIHISSPQ